MLSTMRSSWLLFALFALVALTAAFSVEDAFNIDGINAYLHHGIKRQAEGTQGSSTEAPSNTRRPSPSPSPSPSDNESTPTPEPSTPSPPPSSTQESSAENSPSPSPSPSTTPSDVTSSPSRTAPSSPTPTPSDNKSTPSSPSNTPSARVSTKALLGTTQQPFTVITTIVDGNGQTREIASTGTRDVEITTGTSLSTLAADSNNGGGGGGLSSSSKAIIGGVIGGVGGAILLGGIVFVCWRMWGKKKRVSEDDADLMAGTGAALGDKGHGTPFQSNLEQYHNPGGRPNAAANF